MNKKDSFESIWVQAESRTDSEQDLNAIAERYEIDPMIARIIKSRGVDGDEAIRKYLYGAVPDLYPPKLMKGCVEAAKLLKQKIEEGKRIRIIGDYDIDGVCATYILYRIISRCGGTTDYRIPDRIEDGYGLNQELLEAAVRDGIDTVITCDNGISAIEEIRFAKQQGLTVIVTDHHEPKYEETEASGRRYLLPEADVLVNPKQPGCTYPFRGLCGAAVAWKVVCMLGHICGLQNSELCALLPFVGIATIGDVMDLVDENRILAREGLRRIAATDNLGLRALAQVNEIDLNHISSYHIGFVIGPCINASGRLDSASRSVELFLAKSEAEALELAGQLKALNDKRKAMTEQAVGQACEEIEAGKYGDDRVLVVYLPDCHESIAGIVAGKLREYYYRPVFVVTDTKDGAKGSGRSIEEYPMFDEMVKCEDLFRKYGGHAMAAGFSLKRENIETMRRRMNENCTLSREDLTEKLRIDAEMPLGCISERLVEQLSLLEPFGKGNEKPNFTESELTLYRASILGKNANVLKFRAGDREGHYIDALYFGNVDEMRAYLEKCYGKERAEGLFGGRGGGMKLAVAYYPSINEYMGRRSLQITIKSYRQA